jgi:hypothetical protein
MKASRWIDALDPLLQVCARRAKRLGLGKPSLEAGPTFLSQKRFEDLAGDRIRKGAVWFINKANCGFHVDFCANKMTHIEAWQGGERRVSCWISGEMTEQILSRELSLCLAAAGLPDLARTEEVRATLFSRE